MLPALQCEYVMIVGTLVLDIVTYATACKVFDMLMIFVFVVDIWLCHQMCITCNDLISACVAI